MTLRPEIERLLLARRFTRFLNLTKDVPWRKGECAWCNGPGRKGLKYCSLECSNDANIRASGNEVRRQVFRRDHGVCVRCGIDCVWLEKQKREITKTYSAWSKSKPYWAQWGAQWGAWQTENYQLWEAHHIIPVHKGGGVCGLDNYETLCLKCHKQERKEPI